MTAFLQVNQLACHYDTQPVLLDLSFTLAQHEISCLLGPSGCGKTTLLQAIAGFIPLSQGQIRLQGRLLSAPNFRVAPEQRKIGMVFQDYALFPHLTVSENIRFGLHHLHCSRQQQYTTIAQMLALVKIRELAGQYPHQLSCGQKQRVALARALATQPQLLLMDEPFSSLDAPLKQVLYDELRTILHTRNITALIVTHDKNEAFALSDTTGLLLHYHVAQWDKPAILFNHPSSPDVARFIGRTQTVTGVIGKPGWINSELGPVAFDPAQHRWLPGTPLTLFFSPEEISLHHSAQFTQGRVTHKVFMGTANRYTLLLPSGRQIQARTATGDEFEIGETVGIQINTRHLVGFPSRDDNSQPLAQKTQPVSSATYARP